MAPKKPTRSPTKKSSSPLALSRTSSQLTTDAESRFVDVATQTTPLSDTSAQFPNAGDDTITKNSERKETQWNKPGSYSSCTKVFFVLLILFGVVVVGVGLNYSPVEYTGPEEEKPSHEMSQEIQTDNLPHWFGFHSVLTNNRVLIVLFLILSCTCICFIAEETWNRHGTSKELELSSEESLPEHSRGRYYWGSYFKLILPICVISFGWEFMRMYQEEVAKKMSSLKGGIPDACSPGAWTSFKLSLLWLLSWDSGGDCELYYSALIIDPFWEVNPSIAITSAVSRCIITPINILCSTVGKCFKLAFIHIPFQWQLIFVAIVIIIFLVLAFLAFAYKISGPGIEIGPSRTS